MIIQMSNDDNDHVRTHLCVLVNTCMYIMYVLNFYICVNELVFPSVYSVLVYHGYTNANIGS